jgi:hypothetical protein
VRRDARQLRIERVELPVELRIEHDDLRVERVDLRIERDDLRIEPHDLDLELHEPAIGLVGSLLEIALGPFVGLVERPMAFGDHTDILLQILQQDFVASALFVVTVASDGGKSARRRQAAAGLASTPAADRYLVGKTGRVCNARTHGTG